MTTQPTTILKTAQVKRQWHVIDAKGQILGQVATKVARILMGKHRPDYTPHIDSGDYVIVINSRDVVVTGNKAEDKKYYRHSGFPGGLKTENFNRLIGRAPAKVIEHAVKGMLPKNKLQTPRLRRLKAVPGAEHMYQDKLTKE